MPVKKISPEDVLATLIRDPSISLSGLMRTLDVSEPTIRRHLARLLQSGVLSRRKVVAPGYYGVRTKFAFLLEVDHRCLSETIARLVADDEVQRVSVAASAFDIFAQATFRSNEHVFDFLVHKLGALPGIRRVERVQVLRSLKHGFGAEIELTDLPNGTGEPIAPYRQLSIQPAEQADDTFELDAMDEHLIRAMTSGQEPTVRSLAAELGVAESTIVRRLSRLQAQGILAELLVIHPERVGFPLNVYFLFRTLPNHLIDVARALARLPELAVVNLAAGDYNLTATGYFRSDQHLVSFITSALGRLVGVANYRVAPFLATPKSVYNGALLLPPNAWLKPQPLSALPLD